MVPFIGHPWLGQGTAESRTAGWRDLAAYPRKGDARTLNAQVSKSEWKGQYKLKRACSEFHYFPLLCSSASAFLYMYVHYTSRPPPPHDRGRIAQPMAPPRLHLRRADRPRPLPRPRVAIVRPRHQVDRLAVGLKGCVRKKASVMLSVMHTPVHPRHTPANNER
jgi:hypothetical protein